MNLLATTDGGAATGRVRPPETTFPGMEDWWRLADTALEPSAPLTPAFAIAAMRHLPPQERPALFTVADAGGPQALAVLRRDAWRWRPLGRLASSRWGDFFFLGTPLLARENAREALRRLLDHLAETGFSALEICSLPANGPVAGLLRETLAERGTPAPELARWRRAVLDATRPQEEWWRSFRSKRRRYWRGQWRQLEKMGTLSFERLAAGEDVTAWTEEFLALEAAGWKGRAGTALASTPHNGAFARAMIEAFHARGDLRFWRLRLNGRAIASLFGFLSQGTLWLGKIAYDESLRKYSPGVLLTLEATKDIFADAAIAFADSCAAPDHPMIDHLWPQRLALVDLLVPLPGVSRTRFALIAAAEKARRAARERAKRAWHALRGTRPV